MLTLTLTLALKLTLIPTLSLTPTATMQAKEAAAKQRRMAAYNALQGMTSPSVEQLSSAIEEARDAGEAGCNHM